VLAESFERIHRSNLVGMGVLPLVFKGDMTRKSLGLDGSEIFDIVGLAGPGKAGNIKPRMDVAVRITRAGGKVDEITATCRIDTAEEVEYFRHGGVLPYVLRNLAGV
jgi:aconitate hydratase